jgi:hypothetical protein
MGKECAKTLPGSACGFDTNRILWKEGLDGRSAGRFGLRAWLPQYG